MKELFARMRGMKPSSLIGEIIWRKATESLASKQDMEKSLTIHKREPRYATPIKKIIEGSC